MSFDNAQTQLRHRSLSAIALACGLALAGCSTISNTLEGGSVDYKTAKRVSTLEIPPDLTQVAPDDRFAQPKSASANEAARAQQAAKPASSAVAPTAATARIVRAGELRWLQVDQPIEKVWPLVRQFWLDQGFSLTTDQPQIGLLETDWAENRAKVPQDFLRKALGSIVSSMFSTGERDSYRITLERVDGGTEVRVAHRGMEEVWRDERIKDQTVWQRRASDPSLEAEFLQRMLVQFGAKDAQKAADVATAKELSPIAKRVTLAPANRPKAIQYAEGFDRAWRVTGVALDRVGFAVEDRDRAQGVFYVRYRDDTLATRDEMAKEKSKGFLSRWFSSDDEDLSKTRKLRIAVTGDREQSKVVVQDDKGQVLDNDLSVRVLTIISEQMR